MIVNDNGVDREMTADEVSAWNASMAEVEAFKESVSDLLKARLAVLKKLGLTDAEARLLLN